MSLTEEEVEQRLTIEYVPVAAVHPNPWNPNVESKRTYKGVRESIADNGFVDPINVRPHPTLLDVLVAEGGDGWSVDQWQILGGEHRWRAAQDEGHTLVPITNIAAVQPDGVMTDVQAKKATLSLNMGGENDIVPLARLLVDLNNALPDLDALGRALPFDSRELEELLKIGAIDFGMNPNAEAELEAFKTEQGLNQRAAQFYAVLQFDQGQRERYDAFMEMLQREGPEGESAEAALLSALGKVCQGL